jgi:hypothetical protein
VAYFGPLGEHSSALVHYMESVPGEAVAGASSRTSGQGKHDELALVAGTLSWH